MELWLDILIRVLAVGYIGVGGWMSARLLQRAGISWGWCLLLWAPAVCWLIPGIAIAGLLAAPIPVILTWAFAYAEWPALIDVGRIGRRSRHVADEDQPTPLSKRARAHTFFAGMEHDGIGERTEKTAAGKKRKPAVAGLDKTAPFRRKPDDDVPVLKGAALKVPVVKSEPATPKPTQAGGVSTKSDRRPSKKDEADNWMLSGFDEGGRVLRHQVRAADIRACEDGFVLGRNPQSANLVLPDESVSRRHARLRMKGRRLMIEDLGSANGTWVDGRELTPGRASEIAHGAALELGGVKLTLTVA